MLQTKLHSDYPTSDYPTQFLAVAPSHHLKDLSNAKPTDAASRDREAVRIIVVGSKQGIEAIIRTLYHRHFARVDEWSPLIPYESGKFMRIPTRYIFGAIKENNFSSSSNLLQTPWLSLVI